MSQYDIIMEYPLVKISLFYNLAYLDCRTQNNVINYNYSMKINFYTWAQA